MDRVIEKRWDLPITPCQIEWHAGRRSRLRLLTRRIERSIERNHGFVLVDTLKYLTMGGRIGRAEALLGGVLQFKPIVGIRDGETHPVDRPRTRRRAQARAGARRHGLFKIVRELAPIHQLHLSYSTGARITPWPFTTSWPTFWSRSASSSPGLALSWVLTSVPIPSAWRQPRKASRTTSCSQWERRLDRYYNERGCSNRPKAREGGLETRRERLGPNRPALFMSVAF